MLSMTKGVPEFDSVQNQDTECLSPSYHDYIRLKSVIQDELKNKRALVDRKRERAFVMLSSHFLLLALGTWREITSLYRSPRTFAERSSKETFNLTR